MRWAALSGVNAESLLQAAAPLRKAASQNKLGGKVDHIPVCATGKAIIVIVRHVQAGMPVVVERAECHALPVDRHAVPLRCFPAAYAIFDVLKTDSCVILRKIDSRGGFRTSLSVLCSDSQKTGGWHDKFISKNMTGLSTFIFSWYN